MVSDTCSYLLSLASDLFEGLADIRHQAGWVVVVARGYTVSINCYPYPTVTFRPNSPPTAESYTIELKSPTDVTRAAELIRALAGIEGALRRIKKYIARGEGVGKGVRVEEKPLEELGL